MKTTNEIKLLKAGIEHTENMINKFSGQSKIVSMLEPKLKNLEEKLLISENRNNLDIV